MDAIAAGTAGGPETVVKLQPHVTEYHSPLIGGLAEIVAKPALPAQEPARRNAGALIRGIMTISSFTRRPNAAA